MSPLVKISRRQAEARRPDARLVLPFQLRSRSRFRAQLDNGESVGVMLARGQVLRGGDLLLADDGRVVSVEAARESVSTVFSGDPRLLARAAYHLGNRHVALQIDSLWLRYGHDHVLDDMVRGLGLRVVVDEQPFEPEAGAYHSDSHGHGAAHGHAHDGGHDHDH